MRNQLQNHHNIGITKYSFILHSSVEYTLYTTAHIK